MLVHRLRRRPGIKSTLIQGDDVRILNITIDIVYNPAIQRQTAVTAYLKSKQLQLFVITRQVYP